MLTERALPFPPPPPSLLFPAAAVWAIISAEIAQAKTMTIDRNYFISNLLVVRSYCEMAENRSPNSTRRQVGSPSLVRPARPVARHSKG